MLSQIKARLSGIPRMVWIVGAGLVLIAVLGVIAILVFDPFGGPLTDLNAANPSLVHPDGLVVSLAQGTPALRVRVTTVPREAFTADEAGGDWTAAHQALPANLTPLGPIYIIHTRGEGQMVAEMAIPNGAEPLALLDLYRWDRDEHRWVFVPSSQDVARQVITFNPPMPDTSVMAFHVQPESPAAGVIISQGGPDLGSTYGLSIPEGTSLDAQGNIVGAPVATSASTVLPLVDNRSGGFMAYPDPPQQAHAIDQLTNLILPYNGLVLDFTPGQGYGDFLAALAERIHAHGKRLDIVLRGTSFDSATLIELASNVDHVWVAPGDNPTLYLPNGPVEKTLTLAVGSIDRNKLGLLVSGLSVDVAGDSVTPISLEQALAPFGSVEPVAGYFDPNVPLMPGDNLALHLTGQVESIGFDATLGMNYLTYHDASSQLHTIYFSSASSLNSKLEWARTFGLSAVAVQGLAHPDAPVHLADGLSAFLIGEAIGEPNPLKIVWRVTGASGASLAETEGDLSLVQYLWQVVSDQDQVVISAGVKDDGDEAQVGQVVVNVGQPIVITATPTPTPTATPASRPTPNPNATPAPQPTTAPVSGSIAPGDFEWGGQTQSLTNPDKMHYAGMTWVKFQHKWSPGEGADTVAGPIQQGHAAGFKVLLSIPGPQYPTGIDYSAYVNFLAGVAAMGPDGIEIWNEMNLQREWPADQMDGAIYVNQMLAPAYQTIKGINPNILVISGAPAPTGLWGIDGCGNDPGGEYGCSDYRFLTQMRDAGAAQYLDCVGTHYNEGIIPPSQTSGDPRDYDYYTRYFFGMLNYYYSIIGKPVCFTELGYLTPEGYGTLPPAFGWAQNTTVAQQAQWLADAAVLSSQSGKVRLMIIFNVDFTTWGADPQAGYAIVRPGGSCPACEALHAVEP